MRLAYRLLRLLGFERWTAHSWLKVASAPTEPPPSIADVGNHQHARIISVGTVTPSPAGLSAGDVELLNVETRYGAAVEVGAGWGDHQQASYWTWRGRPLRSVEDEF